MSMKNAKLLSPLRFYRDLIMKRKNSAMKELDSERDIVFFTPILSLLAINILLLIIIQSPIAIMILAFSGLLIIGHAIIFSQVNIWLSKEKRRIQKEEELRKEAERKEQMNRLWQEYVENMYRQHYRQEEERRQRREREESRRRTEYENRNNSVDQNIVNAMKLMGLQKGFTMKDLKSAYRKLSKVHHPDAGGLEANFKKLNTAYNYLMERM